MPCTGPRKSEVSEQSDMLRLAKESVHFAPFVIG